MRWLFVVVLLLGAVGPRPARADDVNAAKATFREGRRLFEVGEFRPALAKFKSAYLQFDAPALLYNIAQCHVRLGEKREAVSAYRKYLERLPQATDRPQVEQLLAKLETEIAAETVATPTPTNATPTADPTGATTLTKQPLTKRPWFWGVVGGGAAVVIIALGVGLGVGLSKTSYPAFESKPTHGTINF